MGCGLRKYVGGGGGGGTGDMVTTITCGLICQVIVYIATHL